MAASTSSTPSKSQLPAPTRQKTPPKVSIVVSPSKEPIATTEVKQSSVAITELDDSDSCAHTTIECGACLECGLCISDTGSYISYEESYSNAHQRSTTVSSLGFEKDLKKLDLPMNIKSFVLTWAMNAPKKIFKGTRRNQVLFAAIYLAYLNLGCEFKPESINDQIKLSLPEMQKAMQIASGICKGVNLNATVNEKPIINTAPVVAITPLRYLDEAKPYFDRNNITNHLDNLKEFMTYVLDKRPMLMEKDPRKMAIAFIKYYLTFTGIQTTGLMNEFNVQSTSIRRFYVQIEEAVQSIQQQNASSEELTKENIEINQEQITT